MPNTIFFISADYLSFKDWPAEAKNIYPSVLIEQSQPQQTLELYKYCNTNPLHNFSISILITDPLNEEFINTAVSFLFIPYYYAVNNKRIITLTGKDEKLLHDAKSSLLAFSAEQGINNLVINCLLKKDISNLLETESNTSYLFTDTEIFISQYGTTINSAQVLNSYFYLYDAKATPQKLSLGVLAADEEFEKANPLLHKAMKELDKSESANESLKIKIAAVETELNNYKSHLEILRSSHQAKELQEYYNAEYEVLPLWYKRFGHIVKVITGKRRFRSLFTDKIKKSKD